MNDYRNLATMSDDEIYDFMNDSPKEFANNLLAQIRSETFSGVDNMMAQKAESKKAAKHQKDIKATYDKYAKQNPGFTEMLQSGKLKAFMAKHPGFNALAAHGELTIKSKIEKAIEKAKGSRPATKRHPSDTMSDIAASLKASRQGRGSSKPNPENLDAQDMVETVELNAG